MVKKFSYLVSVSILASNLMNSASYAVYENELCEHIKITRTQLSSSPRPADLETDQLSSPSSIAPLPTLVAEESSYLWNTLSWIGSTSSTALGTIAYGTGHSFRYIGDSIRGDTFVGDVLTTQGLSLAGTTEYRGVSAASLVVQVKDNGGAVSALRKNTGNALRRIGASIVGETPTLERAIRQFWADRRLLDDPEEAFVSTACALYEAELEVDEIKLAYRRFIEAWNGSSYTEPSVDRLKNTQRLLTGLIRAFVRSEIVFCNLDTQLVALGITYEDLPVTNGITLELVVPDVNQRSQRSVADLQQVVLDAREVAFRQLVSDTRRMEEMKKRANESYRPRTHAFPPSGSTLLAIEGQPSADPAPMSGAGDGIRITEIPNRNGSDLSQSDDQSNMDNVD